MTRRSARRANRSSQSRSVQRKTNYSALKNPLIRQPSFSEDRLEALHQTALRVLEELGIRVLNPQALNYFREAGATINNDMVRIDRALVEQALKTAPSEFVLHGATPEKNVTLGGDNIAFCRHRWASTYFRS